MARTITLNVNGKDYSVKAEPANRLLFALRNDLGFKGPRFGCGLSECGACTVIMDGTDVRSCVTPLMSAEGHKITTLEGLGTVDNPSPVQKAFIEEQAGQCAYCSNGMIMRATVLLQKKPNPSRDEIKKEMNPILCRCGTHMRIVRAIERAAKTMSGNGSGTNGGN